MFKKDFLKSVPSLSPAIDDKDNDIHFSSNYKGYCNMVEFLVAKFEKMFKLLGVNLKSIESISRTSTKVYLDLVYEKLTIPKEVRVTYSLSSEVIEPVRMLMLNSSQVYNHGVFWRTFGTQKKKMRETMKSLVDVTYSSRKPTEESLPYSTKASFHPKNPDITGMKNAEVLRQDFITSALHTIGSGWLWLCLHNGQLEVRMTPGASNLLTNKERVVLGCIDLWEHSYYAKYLNDKAKYVSNLFEIIDWDIMESRIPSDK